MIIIRCVLLMLALVAFSQPLLAVATKEDRQALIATVIGESGLPESYVRPILMQAEYLPSVIQRIKTPYEGKPYREYRRLFVNEKRIQAAIDYLQLHRRVFDQCEQRYGVQREMIAAILAMETRFGAYMGRDRVIDALFTLAAGYPKRARFFRGELVALLQLAYEEHLDVHQLVGSYAGAFGVTQFIPSSYRAYAVDADGDGQRDVWHTPADIVCSVGNYFHEHHWDASRPVLQWLPDQESLRGMKVKRLKQWREYSSVAPFLTTAPVGWKADDRVNIIDADAGEGRELALVHYNFYVITRWNRAFHYAMAASELAAAIAKRRRR